MRLAIRKTLDDFEREYVKRLSQEMTQKAASLCYEEIVRKYIKRPPR